MSPEEAGKLDELKRQVKLEKAQQAQFDQAQKRKDEREAKRRLRRPLGWEAWVGVIGVIVLVYLLFYWFLAPSKNSLTADQQNKAQVRQLHTAQRAAAAVAFYKRWISLGVKPDAQFEQHFRRVNSTVFESTVTSGGQTLYQIGRFTCDDTHVNRQLESCYKFEP